MELLSNFLDFWPLLIILIIIWSCIIYLATKWTWFKDQKDIVKTTTEIMAVLIAAIWVYQTFIYEEWIKPAIQPPHVVLNSSANIVGEKDNLYVVQLKSTLTNSSKVRVDILSFWMDVYSYTIMPSKNNEEFTGKIINDLNSEKFTRRNIYARDYIQSAKPVVTQIQQLFSGNWWLEPGEIISAERTIYISNKYDVAQINFYARTTKNKSKLCIKWGKNDPGGTRPEEIGPLTYLKTGGTEKCNKKDGYEKFDSDNDDHQALRDKIGLSTTVSRLEIPLIQSQKQ